MPKPHKIKKYSQKTGYRAGKRRKKKLWTVLFGILLVALVFVGVSAYPAVKDYFDGKVLPTPIQAVESQPMTIESSKVDSEVAEIPPAEKALENIMGGIVPYETAGSPLLLEEFLKKLSPEINTVLFRIKDSLGKVYFPTENPTAIQWEAVVGTVDLEALASAVVGAGYDFGVIQSVFSDPIAARGNLEGNAIMHSSGVIWLDNSLANGGKPWTTPYSESGRQYNLDIAKEAVEKGASVVLFEYMRFPNDVTASGNVKAVEGVSRAQVLEGFYKDALATLGEGVLVAPVASRMDAEGTLSNDQLYGGDPMALEIPAWVVDLEDDSSPLSTNAFSEKRVILMVEESQQSGFEAVEHIVK